MSSANVRHVSITIQAAPERVYEYASDPRHLPAWASGLANSIKNIDGQWRADSVLGPITIRFTPRNDLGVLDHDVTLPSGVTVHNPLRVVPHGAASEVVFSVFRQPDVTAARFEDDVRAVTRDLEALKQVIERSATP
jgi:hypothetical protein